MDKATDECWRETLLIDGFNEACKNIAASFMKVRDDSMSAIRFRETAKGNLRQSHWGHSSIQLPVLLHGPCYSFNSREGRKR